MNYSIGCESPSCGKPSLYPKASRDASITLDGGDWVDTEDWGDGGSTADGSIPDDGGSAADGSIPDDGGSVADG